MSLLQVNKISKSYKSSFFRPRAQVLSAITFSISKGQSFALVGQSGTGKTTIARIIAGLTKPDNGLIIKPPSISMVFQNPKDSLDPRMKVRQILAEPFYLAKRTQQLDEKINKLLVKVELEPQILDKYPYQLSGGQQQRIAIARSIALNPQLIILDEPFSSLDKLAQYKIAKLLLRLQKEEKLTYLLITHDLGIANFLCQNIAVIAEGKIVQQGPVEKVLKQYF